VADILFAQERLADRVQAMDRTRWSGDPVDVAIRAARLLRLSHAPSLIVQNSLPAPAAIGGINCNFHRTELIVGRRFNYGLEGSRQLAGHGKLGGHNQREPQTNHEQNARAEDEGASSFLDPFRPSPRER
jgi:hypothetical protein